MVFFVPFWEGGNIYSCSDMDYVKEYCLEVDAANYKCVYSDRMLESDDLDGLYATFNDNPPADYKVHSLSVSDVVIMHQNGETKAYYVDQFKFNWISVIRLPDFVNQKDFEWAVETATKKKKIDKSGLPEYPLILEEAKSGLL